MVYRRYEDMNFSLHYSIKYFKNKNCFPSILNLFFQLFRLLWKDFQRNVHDSIHMSDMGLQRRLRMFILFPEISTGHA